jgi:hypothetical protein
VAAILLELSKPQQDTSQFGIHGREEKSGSYGRLHIEDLRIGLHK